MNIINGESEKIFQRDKNKVKNEKEEIPTSKTRINMIDNIKGILIFSVVFGNFLYNYSFKVPNSLENKIVNYLFSFHIPSFVFWSGFLSKSDNSRSFKSIIKLILIYIIFNFSHGFILYIYENQKNFFLSISFLLIFIMLNFLEIFDKLFF